MTDFVIAAQSIVNSLLNSPAWLLFGGLVAALGFLQML